jgi:hypothetical protein
VIPGSLPCDIRIVITDLATKPVSRALEVGSSGRRCLYADEAVRRLRHLAATNDRLDIADVSVQVVATGSCADESSTRGVDG